MNDKEKNEMYLKIKQLMEKQLELLSHESKGAVCLTELAEISQQMIRISEFLIEFLAKIY